MKTHLFILLLITVLSGCATNSIQQTSLKTVTALPENHGVVAVQVINNTSRLAPLHKGWTEVIAVRLDNREARKQAAIEKAKIKKPNINPDDVEWEPDFYSLSLDSQGVVESQLFSGSMPQGKYIISLLYSYYFDGDISSWVSMPVSWSAGTFDVKANQFTNLGSVVFQPLLNVKEKSFWSSGSSQKAYVTRLNELEDLQKFVIDLYPQATKAVDFSNPLTWEEDELDELRNDLSALSRENAFGDNAMSLSQIGTGAVAAKFGQLRVLKSNGTWQQINLPTNAQISAVHEINNKVIVGAERGLVYFADSLNGSWEKLTPVSATQAIIWFGKGNGEYFALTSSAKDYFVYTFDSINQPWTKIGTFKKKNPNDWLVQNGGLFPIIKRNGEIRILNDNKLFDFSSQTRQWTNTKASSMVKLSQLKNGVLLGLEVSQWDGIGDQVISFDEGNSWNTISRRLDIFGDNKADRSLPAMLDNGTVVTIGRVGDKGKRKLKLITQTKENISDRKSWQAHGEAKKDCHSPLPELTHNNRLYFLCDQGQIVSTDDFGINWTTEVEIDIPSMQQQYDALLEALKTMEPTE